MIDSLQGLCIGELTSILYRQYQLYMGHRLEPFQLNFSEYAILTKIPDEKPPVPQHFLGERLFYDNALITRSLKTLETKEYIVREKSLQDKRQILVSLTSKGVTTKKELLILRKQWKSLVMDGVSPQEEKMVFTLFQKITGQAIALPK